MTELASGQMLDRYRIEEPLGHGGMGQVYRAYDTRLRRRVALKVISRSAGSSVDATLSIDQCARLVREAQAAAALQHPHIVTIFDVGEVDAAPYIAMELLEGKPLRAYIAKTVEIDRKLRWLYDIASALGTAHRAGLVHRDVKPDNIMVCGDDTVKILDFGIAKFTADSAMPKAELGPDSFRTGGGAIVGTPRYMAPEQADGLAVDARADQFAWGLVAYELLAAIHPRDARPGFSQAGGWTDPARPLNELRAELAPTVSSIVMRSLERRPENRFASMDDVASALADHLGAPPRPRISAIVPGSSAPPASTPETMDPTVTSPPTLGAPRPQPQKGEAHEPRPKERRRAKALLVAALAASMVGAIAIARRTWLGAHPSTLAPPATTSATSAPPPAPTAPSAAPSFALPSSEPREASPSSVRAPIAPVSASPSAPAPVASPAAAAPSAASPARRVAVSFKALASTAYSADVIVRPLAARRSTIESCLEGGDIGEGAHVFAYLDYPADGHGARFRFDCREVSTGACQCLSRSFAQPLDLRPPSDAEAGMLSALVSIVRR